MEALVNVSAGPPSEIAVAVSCLGQFPAGTSASGRKPVDLFLDSANPGVLNLRSRGVIKVPVRSRLGGFSRLGRKALA